MMSKLYGVKDIMERYSIGHDCAERYIHEMDHLERPRLLVPEWALEKWEQEQLHRPPGPGAKKKAEKIARMKKTGRVLQPGDKPEYWIPRKRPTDAESA